ncbi:MAG: hypothetical protein WDZ45_08420 [Flavobacteriaceae bacterium]
MRPFLSIFLTLLFAAFIATPTFVVLNEIPIDISSLHSTNEEEKSQKDRNFVEYETKRIHNFHTLEASLLDSFQKNILKSPNSLWNAIYFDIHIPPPEIV